MKVKIGIIGLGNVAQSTYLPLLSGYEKVEIVGAYSPNIEKSQKICAQYRIKCYTTLEALVATTDALFVHSATATHYEIVKYILNQHKHVYVDKPLVETSFKAKELQQIAEMNKVQLMVGFNRRFAPAYQSLKKQIESIPYQYLRVEKHRMGLTQQNIFDLLLDDYIHLVDTICWLTGESLEIARVNLQKTELNQLHFISVDYRGVVTKQVYLQTVSHRNAGTNLEKVTLICDNKYVEVNNFLEMITIQNDVQQTNSMQYLRYPDYYRRGFFGIVDEFITAILEQRDINNFSIDGIYAQTLIEQLKPYINEK